MNFSETLIDISDLMDSPTPIPEDDLDFSTWLKQGSSFIPALDLKQYDTLPAGVYKFEIVSNSIEIVPLELTSDEIYVFNDSVTSRILTEIDNFWSKAELYKKHHLTHKRGILIESGPGMGKTTIITLLIRKLIKNNGLIFYANNAEEANLIFNNLKTIVRKIEPDRPIITVLEDIDKLIEANNGIDTPLLDFMDGKTSIDHHLLILTSNNTSELSSALLRPSRVDLRYIIPNPSESVRKEYFKLKGVDEKYLNEFTTKTNNFSFAQLKEVFIGTQILDKPLDEVIKTLNNPYSNRNYLGHHSSLKI